MTGIADSAAAARTIAAPMPLAPPVTSTTLFSSCRSTVLSQSTVQIHETAIQRVIHSSDERSLVRTQEQGKRGNLLRFSHSADRLRLRQFLEHFLLAAGIVLFQITIDECRMHPGRGNAVTANVVANIVTRDRIGHRNHRAFAGGIPKPISQSGRSGDGGHVENHAAAMVLHVADAGTNTVVVSLNVHAQNGVKILFARALDGANLRNACVIYQDVNAITRADCVETRFNFRLVRYIADIGRRASAGLSYLTRRGLGVFLVDIEDANCCPVRREFKRDRPPNAEATPSHNREFAVQSKSSGVEIAA